MNRASPQSSFARRFGQLASSAALFAIVAIPAAALGQRTTGTDVNRTLRANSRAAAALARAHANWRAAMSRVRVPRTGCAIASYPTLAWRSVPCQVAPNTPFIPRRRPGHPFVVGNGPNDMVPHTNPRTTSADGHFQSVSAGITENGLVGNPGTSQTDAYTLQLNTNTFAPSPGCTAGSGPSCQGWEQFIYENNDSSHQAFIQYWLIAFNTTCPGGWASYPYPGPTDISCYRNSASVSLPGDQPVSNLLNMSLSGEATATSDRVTVRAGASMATTPGINGVGLAAGWTDSEFNIFGDGWGHDATFGANTSMVVRTLVHNGQTGAPTCALTSFTGETNNLTLIGMSAAGPLPSPGVEFTQSNIAGATPTCMGAAGIGDTHLRTFTGLLYDFQATGDFTLAESGNFEAQTRQMSGRPTWPDASLNQSVAARLDKYEVAVCSGSEPRVVINGETRGLSDGEIVELPSGAGIKRIGKVIVMVDSEGNSLRAEQMGSYINAMVGLGHWPAKVRGLLVSGGRSGTDLIGRNGAVLSAPYPFAALYNDYGASWRVPAARSMLRVCGQARETGVPRRPLTPQNLPMEAVRPARAICMERGIRDKGLLDACTIDVAVIGKRNAADTFKRIGRVTAVGAIQPGRLAR